MKKNGFTLIELLAVIIILGILMIIAIPSVTKYISDSRKSSYIDTAKEIISGARNIVNEGKLEMYDTNTTYYIDASCVKTENGLQSPYGTFTKAYVVVTYDGNGYEYYWTSVDDAGQGIKKITRIDKLSIDSIESNLTQDDISILQGIDGRSSTVLVSVTNGCKKEEPRPSEIPINGETGEEADGSVEYPLGKTKETVEVGDIVTIGTEQFYVVKHDGNKLVLLAKYNLKVGNIINANNWETIGVYSSSDSGYGLQSSEVRAFDRSGTNRGTIAYTNTVYWKDKVGTSEYPGDFCTAANSSNCAYVYDSNSNVYTYIENYKTYLKGQGANVKKARLLSFGEAVELGCDDTSCENAYEFVYATSYWFGSPRDNSLLYYVLFGGSYSNGWFVPGMDKNFGIRPVIEI